MTSVFIDANVCLYLSIKTSSFYEQAESLVRSLLQQQHDLITTPYVLNEYHYTLLKLYDRTIAKEQLQLLFDRALFDLVNPYLVIEDMVEICHISEQYKLKTFDAYHAFSCKKLGIKEIATFDTDFERIPWVKIYKHSIIQR